ncbi:MAG: hypothetical protein QME77_01150 [bacterium]|nr:hypothetical protein [bacterium]
MVIVTVQSQKAPAQPSDDFLVVPGERIGPYRLGAPYSFFMEAWGDNDLGAGRERQHCPGQRFAWTVKPMGYTAEFWKDVAVWVGIFSAAHPYYPERDALASKYRTDKGVRLRSSFLDVSRAYGKPDREGRVIGLTYWYFGRTGLRLLLSRGEGEGKVVEIDVVPSGTVLNEHALLPCPPVRER